MSKTLNHDAEYKKRWNNIECFCPACHQLGVYTNLNLYQINLEEAVFLCPNYKNCLYPQGYGWNLLPRKIDDVNEDDSSDELEDELEKYIKQFENNVSVDNDSDFNKTFDIDFLKNSINDKQDENEKITQQIFEKMKNIEQHFDETLGDKYKVNANEKNTLKIVNTEIKNIKKEMIFMNISNNDEESFTHESFENDKTKLPDFEYNLFNEIDTFDLNTELLDKNDTVASDLAALCDENLDNIVDLISKSPEMNLNIADTTQTVQTTNLKRTRVPKKDYNSVYNTFQKSKSNKVISKKNNNKLKEKKVNITKLEKKCYNTVFLAANNVREKLKSQDREFQHKITRIPILKNKITQIKQLKC